MFRKCVRFSSSTWISLSNTMEQRERKRCWSSWLLEVRWELVARVGGGCAAVVEAPTSLMANRPHVHYVKHYGSWGTGTCFLLLQQYELKRSVFLSGSCSQLLHYRNVRNSWVSQLLFASTISPLMTKFASTAKNNRAEIITGPSIWSMPTSEIHWRSLRV